MNRDREIVHMNWQSRLDIASYCWLIVYALVTDTTKKGKLRVLIHAVMQVCKERLTLCAQDDHIGVCNLVCIA